MPFSIRIQGARYHCDIYNKVATQDFLRFGPAVALICNISLYPPNFFVALAEPI